MHLLSTCHTFAHRHANFIFTRSPKGDNSSCQLWNYRFTSRCKNIFSFLSQKSVFMCMGIVYFIKCSADVVHDTLLHPGWRCIVVVSSAHHRVCGSFCLGCFLLSILARVVTSVTIFLCLTHTYREPCSRQTHAGLHKVLTQTYMHTQTYISRKNVYERTGLVCTKPLHFPST